MKWIWPELNEIEDAKKALYNGAGMAFFVTIMTTLVTVLHTTGTFKIFESWSMTAYIDAVLFAGIGFGLIKKSRIVAVAAIIIYFVEQYWMMKTHGFRFSFVPIIIMLSFINAARGAFAFHEMKNSDQEADALQQSVEGEVLEEVQPKKFPFIAVLVILILLSAGLYFLIPALKSQSKPAPSKFKLDGILKDKESMAVINGSLFKIGDTYEGYVVKEIGTDYVIFKDKKQKAMRVDLFPELK